MIDRLTRGRQRNGEKSCMAEIDVVDEKAKEAAEFDKLVLKATEGDHDAILSLCQEIARGVLFHANRILLNYEDAGDVAQEVMIRVCDRIRNLKDPGAFKIWLNTIITNEANRYMMKNSKHSVVLNISDYMDAVEEDDAEFLPQEHAIREEARMAVIDAIDTLPGKQREAVVLYYYEGLSVSETATVMEVSQPRVSECIVLAREKVRYELQKQQSGKVTGGMYGIAAMPMGAFMTQAMQQEAELFGNENSDWIQQTIVMCGEFLQKVMPEAAAGTAAWLLALKAAIATPVAGVAATAVTIAAVTVGVHTANIAAVPEEAPLPETPAVAIEVEGNVVFTGGDGTYAHINPGRAIPALSSNYGDVDTLSWQITTPGGNTVLYSGEGGVVDSALVEMRTRGMDGDYEICFFLEDAQGDTYTLKSNFLILTGRG